MSHQPVLLTEVIAGLNIQSGGIYIDGTFGRGGHSQAIVERLGPQGRLIVLDQDPEAIAVARATYGADSRVTIVHSNFSEIAAVAAKHGVFGFVNGVLLDLGVSSPQLDDAARGFSFMHDGPLDMRMDISTGITAEVWLATVKEAELKEVLIMYGEERFSGRIARAIVETRQQYPIKTTVQLADIISKAVPFREKHKHPATRCFQAIRIYLNQELRAIELALERTLPLLTVGGRIAVISFHSLEDRIVKHFMRRAERGDCVPRGLPVLDRELNKKVRIVNKAIRASDAELKINNRARSALLRIAEKIA